MSYSDKIKLKAKIENLPEFIKFVSEKAKSFGFSEEKISDIELATEEVVTNIFNYAYKGPIEDVEITCKHIENKFIIEIVDTGIPFNILDYQDPKFGNELSEVNIGGLGVYMVKKLMNGVQYCREANKNILILTP